MIHSSAQGLPLARPLRARATPGQTAPPAPLWSVSSRAVHVEIHVESAHLCLSAQAARHRRGDGGHEGRIG